MVKIGNVSIDGILALAPMAGTSTVTFRGICHEFGSSYAPTELVSARSILYNGIDKSFKYLNINQETEGITCIQLFGNEPDDFDFAIKAISEDKRLHTVDIIDINMGCPVTKVVKTGAGSGLIKEPKLAAQIIKTSKKAAELYGKPVTVKTRIGFDAFTDKSIDYIKGLADEGVDAICIHGRTAKQMYSGLADIEAIAQIRDSVREYKIPFIANGDIKDGPSARNMLDKTEADMLMIGRAAMGNPWIFNEINAYLNGKDFFEVSLQDRCDMLLRELKGTAEQIGEEIAVKEMRSVMPHYIKGFPGSAEVKVKLCMAKTIDEVTGILGEYLG